MSTFFLTFLAVALAMLAGREALRVARISAAGAGGGALLGVIVVCAIGACAAAAALALTFADLLTAQQKGWFVAAALVLAAAEVMFLDAPDAPSEPTHSLGAIGIVLFAGIMADASGLLVLSLSVASGSPVMAGAGGALAALGVLSFAAFSGEDWEKLPRHVLRPVVAALLVAGAVFIGFFAPQAAL